MCNLSGKKYLLLFFLIFEFKDSICGINDETRQLSKILKIMLFSLYKILNDYWRREA